MQKGSQLREHPQSSSETGVAEVGEHEYTYWQPLSPLLRDVKIRSYAILQQMIKRNCTISSIPLIVTDITCDRTTIASAFAVAKKE